MPNGDFTSLREAKKAAAELALVFSRDTESGFAEVSIIRSNGDGSIPDLIATASARLGNKRVSWQ